MAFELVTETFNFVSFFDVAAKRCYQNEPKFKGVYSRNSLPRYTKDVEQVINLHHSCWMSYWNNNAIYFDVEHMPKSDFDDNDLRAKVYSNQANN